ncbi:hypothetical protein GCM10009780_16530 [Actinomadura alba]
MRQASAMVRRRSVNSVGTVTLVSVRQDADVDGAWVGPRAGDAQRVVRRVEREPVGAQQVERVTPRTDDLDRRVHTAMASRKSRKWS